MSWLFSQALGEAFLAANCLVGKPSAPLKATHTPQAFWSHDKTTVHFIRFQSGLTSVLSMVCRGEDVLTWFRGAFHAKPIPPRLRAKALRMISGRKCGASWQMSLPGTYLPRTPQNARLTVPPMTLKRWVTRSGACRFPRQTWVLTTFGKDSGYLHTPTCAANYSAPSMQKHACAREFVRVFGTPSPINAEWLMGWPTGWTDLKPLETDKFQVWQQEHLLNSQVSLSEAA